MVRTQQSEAAVGEEEGPSEVVPMHEPMEKTGKNVMKQEIIKEERAVEENPAINMEKSIPRDLPPVAETEKVMVKQEWVELCEQ